MKNTGKKKILITMTSMFIGGAERSLLGLLDSFDYTKYDVYLFLYRHEGELLQYIPEEVHILPEIKAYGNFDKPILEILFSNQFFRAIFKSLGKISLNLHCLVHKQPSSLWKSLQMTTQYLLPTLPKISGEYDAAIGFIGIHDVLNKKVTAKVKLGWIHTDYSQLNPIKEKDIKTYSKLDYIVLVSEDCKKQFLKIYPQFEKKTIVIENMLSPTFIREQSMDPVVENVFNNSAITFCSVGRFSDAKNFENVPCICKKILDNGYDIVWYLIGYGGDEDKIKQAIKEYHMEKNVVILGKKINPYPYIKNSDFYIQPSKYEGKAVAVREAQILNKPVIITNFATSSNQLADGEDGFIVPLDNDGCANGIISILNNKESQKRVIENTKHKDYENKSEIAKLYKIIEEAEANEN